MDSINISLGMVEATVSEITDSINERIIEGAKDSKEEIINLIEDSSGAFIDSLKEAVEREVRLIEDIGNLLIAATKYVESAAEAFTEVDQSYDFNKFMLP